MVENFQLKEQIASLQLQLQDSAAHQQELKEKLRTALQEIETGDELIEKCRDIEE